MARTAVALIDKYFQAGVMRYNYKLPMYPADIRWHEGNTSPPTATLLGFQKEDFAQVVS